MGQGLVLPISWTSIAGQCRRWTGVIWVAEVNECLSKPLASPFSRTPPRLLPSRKRLMSVVGPWEVLWGFSQACSSTQLPAGGGSISALGGSFLGPGLSALECGAQMWRRRPLRVSSCPVRSCHARLGRPELPPCPGTQAAGCGHQASAGTEAASPAPGPALCPAPTGVPRPVAP